MIKNVSISLLCVVVVSLLSQRARGVMANPDFSNAALELIARVLPQHAGEFRCESIPDESGKDVFEIEAGNGNIVLRGNDGVSLAMAFDWYLRYEAKTSYDWQAIGPIDLPGSLPVPPTKIRHVCLAHDRFFLNYCTYGYTFPFTDFTGWQRFIDWMAMNGVNRPLAQCGLEATWYRVWKSYGLTDEQIRTYFVGPAHLSWQRMTNIDKWGGPLPMSYIDGQMNLQIKILASERALGMKPILSGFAGHVPEILKTVKPEAHISQIPGHWAGFDSAYGTWFLASADPLFKEIQVRFLREQAAMYGTDHLYAADPFNEIKPPSWEPKYLANVARSIYEGMVAGDPDAKWYQMSWNFGFDENWLKPSQSGQTPFDAMTQSVPSGKLIYLDYVCEEYEMYKRTENFAGAPFIWNYLGNFGGCTYMLAPVGKIADGVSRAMAVPNCIGVGSTLEGLSTNPIAYELTLEQPWHDNALVDLKSWCDDYAARRAGRADPAVAKAWQTLRTKVLEPHVATHYDRSSVLVSIPRLGKQPAVAKTALAGEVLVRPVELTSGLAEAIEALFNASPESQTADGYQYDAVNFVRQYVAYDADNTKARMLSAYYRQDIPAFRAQSDRLLNEIRDTERLLATRHEYLLGPWIRDARAWAANPTEADYYERNARLIVSSWGPPGGDLTDYARRAWSGMLSTYYLPRWVEFVKRLDESLVNHTPFDADAYTKWRIAHETNWVNSTNGQFPLSAQGDAVATAKSVFAKYRAPAVRLP
jgi:alpha-N-acetylglucosaminidase